MKRTLFATAALGLALAVAVPLAAQPMRENAQGARLHMIHGGWGGGPGGPGGFARMCENADAKIAGLLAYAERRLAITEQQRGAWTAFADAVRAAEPRITQTCDTQRAERTPGQPPAPPTLPERLERTQAMLAAGVETLNRIQPALVALYGQLTPEQKRIADTMMHRGPGRGGPGRGGPDGDGRRGPGGPQGGPPD